MYKIVYLKYSSTNSVNNDTYLPLFILLGVTNTQITKGNSKYLFIPFGYWVTFLKPTQPLWKIYHRSSTRGMIFKWIGILINFIYKSQTITFCKVIEKRPDLPFPLLGTTQVTELVNYNVKI